MEQTASSASGLNQARVDRGLMGGRVDEGGHSPHGGLPWVDVGQTFRSVRHGPTGGLEWAGSQRKQAAGVVGWLGRLHRDRGVLLVWMKEIRSPLLCAALS